MHSQPHLLTAGRTEWNGLSTKSWMRKTGEEQVWRGTCTRQDRHKRLNRDLLLFPGSWVEKCCDRIWVSQSSHPSVELLREGWNHKTAGKKGYKQGNEVFIPVSPPAHCVLRVGFWSGNLCLGSLPKSCFWGLKRCLLLVYLNSLSQWLFLFPAIPGLGNCIFFQLTWGKGNSIAKKKRQKHKRVKITCLNPVWATHKVAGQGQSCLDLSFYSQDSVKCCSLISIKPLQKMLSFTWWYLGMRKNEKRKATSDDDIFPYCF